MLRSWKLSVSGWAWTHERVRSGQLIFDEAWGTCHHMRAMHCDLNDCYALLEDRCSALLVVHHISLLHSLACQSRPHASSLTQLCFFCLAHGSDVPYVIIRNFLDLQAANKCLRTHALGSRSMC